MRFLADESCDFGVVRVLRGAGHDVIAVAEVAPRSDDEAVLGMARRDRRILLTEDKDFGQLVHADQRAAAGVILIRFPAEARADLPRAVLQLVELRDVELQGRFVALLPGVVRIGARPTSGD
ncbi:MAG: DUF5615 family PIN-like protein [Phycisphaerales bacterium]